MPALALLVFCLCNTEPNSPHKKDDLQKCVFEEEAAPQGSVIFLTSIQLLSQGFPEADLESF